MPHENHVIVCALCSASMRPEERFCPQCGEPVAAEPVQIPPSETSTIVRNYRNAAEKPRPIVLVGIWLFFAPQAAALVFLLCAIVAKAVSPGTQSDSSLLSVVATCLLFVALLTVMVMILWNATVKHLRSRLPRSEPIGGFPVLRSRTSHNK